MSAKKTTKKATKKASAKTPAIDLAAKTFLAESLDPVALASMGLPKGLTFFNAKGRLDPLVARSTVIRITEEDTLMRTIIMLSLEWDVPRNRIFPTSPLIDSPLFANAGTLAGLETPIESRYFVDVECKVRQSDLKALAKAPPKKTVADLARLIWAGIPESHRARA